MNRFCENKVGANAKGFSNTCLSLNHRNCQRGLVRTGVTRALEQQGRILFVVTVHDDSVEMLCHQFLDCGKRFVAGFNMKIEFAQYLVDYARRVFIRARCCPRSLQREKALRLRFLLRELRQPLHPALEG